MKKPVIFLILGALIFGHISFAQLVEHPLCFPVELFAGDEDNFAQPGPSANTGQFDQNVPNQLFSYTFNFAVPPGHTITSATLTVRLKPLSLDADNDTLSLSSGSSTWNARIDDGPYTLTPPPSTWPALLPDPNPGWRPVNYPDGHIFVFDLGNLDPAGGVSSLLAAMTENGQLTFGLQDDTAVDWINLSLNICEQVFTMGRMTGGGSINVSLGGDLAKPVRITHGFELYCDASKGPNNLQVNWGNERFHLDSLNSALCVDNPSINPNPPSASFDTYHGKGVGRYKKGNGPWQTATAEWTFTDAGEPGKGADSMAILIKVGSTVVLQATGILDGGNHQAHKE